MNTSQRTDLPAISIEQKGGKTTDPKFYEELPVGSDLHCVESKLFSGFPCKPLDLGLKRPAQSSPSPPNGDDNGAWAFQDLADKIMGIDIFHLHPPFFSIPQLDEGNTPLGPVKLNPPAQGLSREPDMSQFPSLSNSG